MAGGDANGCQHDGTRMVFQSPAAKSGLQKSAGRASTAIHAPAARLSASRDGSTGRSRSTRSTKWA